MSSAAGGFFAGSIFAKLLLDKSGWDQSLRSVGVDQKKMQGMSDGMAAGFRMVGSAMVVAGGLIVGGLAKCVKEAMEAGKQFNQLDAVLKSTGGAAGITRDAAIGLSEALQKESTYSHDAILGAENLLLTFTSIGKNVFPAATRAVMDMSTALGEDLKSASIQVGKALQDPVLGMTALRRVGVNFSKDQIAMVKSLVDTGDKLTAQKFILRELATEFGGSALAATRGFGGQMKQLKNDLKDVQEEIGFAVMPVLKNMIASIRPIIERIGEWIKANPELTQTIGQIALKAGVLMLALGPILIIMPKIVLAIKAALGPTGLLVAALGLLAVRAIDATVQFNKVTKAIDNAAANQGKSAGFLEKTLAGLNAAWAKFALGIDTSAEIMNQFPLKTLPDTRHGFDLVTTAIGQSTAVITDIPLDGLNDGLLNVAKSAKEVAKELGFTFKSEIKAKIDEIASALKTYGDQIPKDKQKEMREEMTKLAAQFYDLDPVLVTARDRWDALSGSLSVAFDQARAYWKEQLKTVEAVDRSKYSLDLIPASLGDIVVSTDLARRVWADFGMKFEMSAEEAWIAAYNLKVALWNLSGIPLPTITFDFDPGKLKTETTDPIKHAFDGLYNDIASGWGNTIQKFLEGGTKFKDFIKGIWSDVKNSFFRMVGEMIAKWGMDLIRKGAEGLVSLVSGIGKVGDAAGGVAGAIGGIGGGLKSLISFATGPIGIALMIASLIGFKNIAKGLQEVWKAVWEGAVSILKASAEAMKSIIDSIGGAVSSLFSVFKSVFDGIGDLCKSLLGFLGSIFDALGSIIGKIAGVSKKSSDVTYWLKGMWENLQIIQNLLSADFRGMVHELVDGKNRMIDLTGIVNSHLQTIYDSLHKFRTDATSLLKQIVDEITALPHAAGGMIAMRPTLAMIGENAPRVPEAVIPLPELGSFVAGLRGPSTQTSGSTSLTIVNHFHFTSNDARGVREFVQDQALPIIIDTIETNFRSLGTRTKKSLGVA